MAQYRLSASIIKRSAGRSVTAAAAYRAAEAIPDERTGIVHDFSRKRGVMHSEIIAPEGTPDWMLDRTRLWNAVELAEKRKDAQLAREVQISLPHELTADQRLQLVRDYITETFTPRGIIADVSIHLPGKEGDERNHHAHILLTMRSLTGDGFGPKHRATREQNVHDLQAERETWARLQNEALARYGHPDRVDHRSFADRMIDRSPTQHLGPNASEMERRGEPSRIGQENRDVLSDNALKAEAARRALEREAGRQHQMQAELDRRERLGLLDLDRKWQTRHLSLSAEQERRNGVFKNTVKAEIEAIDQRAEAKGVTRFFRDAFGFTRRDAEQRALHEKTLAGIQRRETIEHRDLETAHQREQDKLRAGIDLQRSGLPAPKHRDKTMPPEPTDDFNKATQPEKPEPQKAQDPPKAEPGLEHPAPSWANNGPSFPSFGQSFPRQAEAWARTDQGREALERDHGQKPNLTRDWDEVLNNPAPTVPSQPETTPDRMNARDWDDFLAQPGPDRDPRDTPAPSLARDWDSVVGKAERTPDRGPDRDGPDRD